MVELTVSVSDRLARRLEPARNWLPSIIELGLLGFRTPAAATATEICEFLEGDPSPRQVLDYHVSDRAQSRLRRLLALNEAGLPGEPGQRELDELQRVEHVMVMLKAQLAEAVRQAD
jgi:hypothetical protein